jgi:predicted amidohydrolase YtcJ
MKTAFLSTRIYTGDHDRPWARALAIDGSRIAAVGSDRDVQAVIDDSWEARELPGRLITPGIVDSHTHFLSLGRTFQWVDLNDLPSLEACRRAIGRVAEDMPPGKWLIGRGWDHHKWGEQRQPSRSDLDDITPRNPAAMIRCCGHSVWVNGLALEKAGIDRHTPDPDGGRIEHFADGEPSGLILETIELIRDHIPEPSPDELESAALAAQEAALAVGVTGVHSCESLADWKVLDRLDRRGLLKLRVCHLLRPENLAEAEQLNLSQGSGSEHLWFGQVKLFADGSMGASTALLHAPYADNPENRGIAVLEPQTLQEHIEAAYGRGWDVAVHAIGDAALTNVLDAVETARRRYPGPHRDRIEHVQLFRPQDLERMSRLEITASVQPVFLATDWKPAEKKWGPDRCRHAYAWKTIARAGIPLQFGSDTPVESINPLFGLHAAVTRQDRQGQPPGGWFPDQKLSLEEAICGFTRQAAWTAGREGDMGVIGVGRKADLTVFDRDLFSLPEEQWLEAGIHLTLVNGVIVYQDDDY